jgi:hypothetical protein
MPAVVVMSAVLVMSAVVVGPAVVVVLAVVVGPAMVVVLTVVGWGVAGARPRAERPGRVAHGEPEAVLMPEAEPMIDTRPFAGAVLIVGAVLTVRARLVVRAVAVVGAVLIVGTVSVVGAEAVEDVVAACCPGHDVLLEGCSIADTSTIYRLHVGAQPCRSEVFGGPFRGQGSTHGHGRTDSHSERRGRRNTYPPCPPEAASKTKIPENATRGPGTRPGPLSNTASFKCSVYLSGKYCPLNHCPTPLSEYTSTLKL